jgi:fumarylacetoacetate (FAA) hydrolase
LFTHTFLFITMKLATYQDGSRDGQLVVVSRDLTLAHYATGVCNTMQQLLDDWNFLSPQLQDLYDALNRDARQGKVRHAFPFDSARCMAPLPRIYQWASSSKATGARLVQQHGGDAVLANLALDADQTFGFFTEGVPPQATSAQLRDGIRLMVRINHLDSTPSFEPVAVTMDELTPSETQA